MGERRFAEIERQAWSGFISVHSRVTRELDAQLSASQGMPLTEFDVLLKLSLAGGRLRMSDLAEACLLSRSGLTRIVDELQGQGLLEREADENDGRVLQATLTRSGKVRLNAGRRAHIANVRRLFLDAMTPAEQEAMATSWAAINANLDLHAGATPGRRARPRSRPSAASERT